MHVSKLNLYRKLVFIYCQMGSLAGAAYLLENNTDDLRTIQCEQKSDVEFKCKICFDFDIQFESGH